MDQENYWHNHNPTSPVELSFGFDSADATLASQSQDIVSTLLRCGINFFAVDFDNTFVDTDTYAKANNSKKCSTYFHHQHVSTAAVVSAHTNVHVNSNSQTQQSTIMSSSAAASARYYSNNNVTCFDPYKVCGNVRPLFKHLLPLCIANEICVGIVTFNPDVLSIYKLLALVFPAIAERMVVVGNDNSWDYMGHGLGGGKQKHLAVAAEMLHKRTRLTIERDTTLLLDDDSDNVRAALEASCRAVVFNPKSEER
jgi:hypothetical protein